MSSGYSQEEAKKISEVEKASNEVVQTQALETAVSEREIERLWTLFPVFQHNLLLFILYFIFVIIIIIIIIITVFLLFLFNYNHYYQFHSYLFLLFNLTFFLAVQ